MSRAPAFVIGSIRVVLADVSPAGRKRIRRTLMRMSDVFLAGEATGAPGFLRAARRNGPAVIVIRSTLARPGLLHAARRVRFERPHAQIIAVTGDETKRFQRTAWGFGVSFILPLAKVELRLPSLVRLAYRDHLESILRRRPRPGA